MKQRKNIGLRGGRRAFSQGISAGYLKDKRVGVILGGISAEREVSLETGRAIIKALREKGYHCITIDAKEDLIDSLRKARIDVAFIALHGRYGEDGTVQGLLEMMSIPYTGSGVIASALGMHKVYSRALFQHNGLPVPPYVVWTKGQRKAQRISDLPFDLPMVVKPAREGSSVGVTIVEDASGFKEALNMAYEYNPEIIIEKYIPGREIQVGVLDDQALGAIEIRPKRVFYDYKAKYTDGLAEHIMPAPLSKAKYEEALDLGLKAHKVLGCEGGTRIDLILDQEERFYLLEVNTLPGMTPLSLLPEIAQGVGISFPDLVERILMGARLKA